MKAKTPLVALSLAAIFLSAQTPHQEAIPAFESVAMAPAAGNPIFEHQLDLHGEANGLHIDNGTPDDFCGILAGFEMTHLQLPGPALLRVDPLVLLVLGRFDANGHFDLPLNYTGEPINPVSIKVQALSVSETGMFGSSNVGAVDFDGAHLFTYRYLGN